MATLAVVPVAAPAPSAAVTLYELEDHLLALAETAEAVPPEQEAAFVAEFEATLTAVVEKRDRVGAFMSHLESQISLGKAEIGRIQGRIAIFERVLDRVTGYVTRVIENLGRDAKGKFFKLEGRTVTFSLRGCAVWPEIQDEGAIPADYKTVKVRLPCLTWEAVLDSLDLELRAAVLAEAMTSEITVSKTKVKSAFEAGSAVPGATMPVSACTLQRR